MGEWGLSPYDASVLVAEQERAAFYEEVAKGRDPKLAANWTHHRTARCAQSRGQGSSRQSVSASKLGGLIDLISDNTISGRIAKEVFAEMVESGKDAASIVEEKGLRQVVDTGAIDKLVDEVRRRTRTRSLNIAAARQAVRLLRRPGDEGFRRQSQSGAAQRHAEKKLAP